ncbi:EGF domain-specific O-linked N-acetylglucosamine transferase-like protein [Hapsidospora chrysogenum ATCC 11550]|uniref:EGF domain-specific O-linked N-acetylglucosamine transferase-like protein n=1 Tax=Hapsidospora chrysogenum (strain ATCC 11550 / CBS 779.69 / DSM 880 / IAM 14645 / JCM 23072 / IMI 49137) TaxID=857340 RepID=A0A086SU10_HAPC1|nr:EGF domain-specific O-linked N-acetylglucosamine transferase-like protein [Hapsidospora chrysogenum ATCC 11550]
MLSMASRPLGLRQINLLSLAIILAFIYILFFAHLREGYLWPFDYQPPWRPTSDTHPAPETPPVVELPPEYQHKPTDNTWCLERYGTKYLTNARDLPVSYCKPQSAANITCFWSQTAGDRRDAMCYAGAASYDASQKKFRLGCGLVDMSDQDKTVPRFPDDLPIYWYETGPGFIVAENVELDENIPAAPANRTSILVKREGSQNPWHSLLEIMSMSWSLDILQIAVDDTTNKPYLDPESGGNTTQIVLLDQHDDGPYIDLWRMFAKMPVRYIKDLGPDEPPSNLVIPFSGGSNTLWQGDWDVMNCRDGALLRTFTDRALEHYDIPTPEPQEIVSVTYIQRTNTRKLLNETEHIDSLRGIPHISLEVVDFEKLTFPRQLDVVRRTDVLVGVHGAGLAHMLFLRPGSVIVEIQPEGFHHQGFRNVAQLMDVGYFRTHAELQEQSHDSDDRWQMEAVRVRPDKFFDIVDMAVKSIYNRAGRSFDAL